MDIRAYCSKLLAEPTGLDSTDIKNLLETPPNPEMGDLAMPCFQLAKLHKKSPTLIAEELAQSLNGKDDFFAKIVAQGPYLNFFFQKSAFARMVMAEALQSSDKLVGHQPIDQGKHTILVEYSSPNIAKPFHVGHGFSTILGDSIAKLFAYHGFTVKRLNHLGDYGTQFGRLIYAWLAWGKEEALQKEPIKELTRVYVKFHEEAEKQPELFDAARKHFKNLEEGQSLEYELWQKFRDLSLEEFERVYERLNVSFDSYNGESFYSDKMPAVVAELKDKNLLVESQNAQVVMLDDYDLNPCIILKSDGSTIYATRDITAILYRAKTWDFYRNIYVVGVEQINHFKQVFAVIDKMGHPKAGQSKHVPFGRISFGEEQFSTRKGKVILLEDFIDETYKHVAEIMDNSSYADSAESADIAEAIAVATVKFLYLRSGREHNISFSWEELLDFNGDTAPYLLYAYARAKSILRKAEHYDLDLSDVDFGLLDSNEEFNLLKQILLLEPATVDALQEYEPSILTRQIIKVVREFNRFYQAQSILKTENAQLRRARLGLIQVFAQNLKIALGLLGIEVVESM